MKNFFKDFRHDLPASIVVFFVAVPLCLGVALASGAPLFAGLIAGIVGGIIVGASSGSALGVSGPAAGLAVIVLTAIAKLGGSWEMFLMAVVLAGLFQVILGFAKAGVIANFFPSSVIQGMLTGIGLLIILKQLPHALGWDKDAFGEEDFFQPDGETTFSEILKAFEFFSVEAIIISVVSLVILVLWDTILSKKHKIFSLINGPLIVVLFGIVLNYCFQNNIVGGTLSPEHLVRVPVPSSFSDFLSQFTLPDFSGITNSKVWEIALVLALVASIETLLSVEATDKLDINKRVTPTNRELKAQGLGNIVSGLIGGLPITQVIVRSSANISFGGKTKLSTISHGFLILLSALTMASVLNMIPLASLATILLLVGYKLAKPAFFREVYKLGWEQFIPFITTVIVIILTDLLKGIAAGFVIALFYTLRNLYKNSHSMEEEVNPKTTQKSYKLYLGEYVSFFNKANISATLLTIPNNSDLHIDYSKSKFIAHDVAELIKEFEIKAKEKNINVQKINFINTKHK